MGILSWIILGILIGALAKWIMPGPDPGGLLITMGLGIAGAFVGGTIATFFDLGTVTGFDLRSVAIATGGALLLLWGHRQIRSRGAS